MLRKEIKNTYGGINTKKWNLPVNRLMPNKYVQAIGPFIFLNHLYPTIQKPTTTESPCGEFSHTHRGIATLTYMFSGEMEHFDSRGNHAVVGAGGVQWMKAGCGINYSDCLTSSFQQAGGLLHLLKFQINLPAKNKPDEPEFINLQSDEIPEVMLPDEAGKLRILIGSFGTIHSPVKAFSHQFLYHFRLYPKSVFTLHTKAGFEYAVFIPIDEIIINSAAFSKSELIIFQQDGGSIIFNNNNISEADIIVFGGEPYTEAIVAEGPFVMNTQAEIAEAYKDFHLGKYGKINYQGR